MWFSGLVFKLVKKLKNNKYFKKALKFFKKDFRLLLPQLYIIGIVLALVLTLLYAVFPQLIFCSQIFGDQICTPVGIYFGLVISLPGYLIAGNLVPATQSLPSLISFLIVIITSVFFYFIIGLLLDKLRKPKTSRINLFILTVFVILIFITLFLLSLLP